MRQWNDSELLSAYADRQSEEAFGVLVERYVALVYSAALRQVQKSHLAAEVAQATFIILAQKARRLNGRTVLSGWLCRTAHFVARNTLKAEFRRHYREQEAHMQSLINEPAPEVWRQLAPLLDEAVAQLNEADRNAVVLRFYERKPLNEVGDILGVDPDAAQKRVSRALDKLRNIFARHGVNSTTAAIAENISTYSVHAAPAMLAKAATAVALAKGATASASTLTLIKGALKIMAWTKAKTAIAVSAATLLAVGTTTITVNEVNSRQFYIGQSSYPHGDSIEITSVRRTKEQLVVKGRYHLVSTDRAVLALYITADAGSVPATNETDKKQSMEISIGRGNFELIHPHLYPGLPHVTMYSMGTNGASFAGVYFGNKDEAAEEHNLPPSDVAN